MARRPADPEEELRWMSQEVRGYVEAVLNSLAANVPKVYKCINNLYFKSEPFNMIFIWKSTCRSNFTFFTKIFDIFLDK